jgi:hypothetical protein
MACDSSVAPTGTVKSGIRYQRTGPASAHCAGQDQRRRRGAASAPVTTKAPIPTPEHPFPHSSWPAHAIWAEYVDLGPVHWIPREWEMRKSTPTGTAPDPVSLYACRELSMQKLVRPTVLREHARVGRTFCASVVERHGHCAARSWRDGGLELIGRLARTVVNNL